jgi:hypothetical protein
MYLRCLEYTSGFHIFTQVLERDLKTQCISFYVVHEGVSEGKKLLAVIINSSLYWVPAVCTFRGGIGTELWQEWNLHSYMIVSDV